MEPDGGRSRRSSFGDESVESVDDASIASARKNSIVDNGDRSGRTESAGRERLRRTNRLNSSPSLIPKGTKEKTWRPAAVRLVKFRTDLFLDVLLDDSGTYSQAPEAKLGSTDGAMAVFLFFVLPVLCLSFVSTRSLFPTSAVTAALAKHLTERAHDKVKSDLLKTKAGKELARDGQALFLPISQSNLQDLFDALQQRNNLLEDAVKRGSSSLGPDDVDILMFLLRHSYAPMTQAMQFASEFDQLASSSHVSVLLNIKARFFKGLFPLLWCSPLPPFVCGCCYSHGHAPLVALGVAQQLVECVPTSDDSMYDRRWLLSALGCSPLQLAIRDHNLPFVNSPACLRVVKDIWGPNLFTSEEMIRLVVLQPISVLCKSVQVRRAMWILNHLFFNILLWYIINDASESKFTNDPLSKFELAFAVFALGSVVSEVGACIPTGCTFKFDVLWLYLLCSGCCDVHMFVMLSIVGSHSQGFVCFRSLSLLSFSLSLLCACVTHHLHIAPRRCGRCGRSFKKLCATERKYGLIRAPLLYHRCLDDVQCPLIALGLRTGCVPVVRDTHSILQGALTVVFEIVQTNVRAFSFTVPFFRVCRSLHGMCLRWCWWLVKCL